MRRSRRIGGIVVAALAAAILVGSSPSPAFAIVGGTYEQQQMAQWALTRFSSAGLILPGIEIRFHAGRDGCEGHLGYYRDEVANICGTHADLMASRLLLHEMAHGWLEVNVTGARRDRFLELRGLTTWNDEGVTWEERGYEQGAEIMAWAIGDQVDGTRAPSIPENARHQLAEAYQLLTDDPLPELAPAMTWQGAL